MIGRRLSFWVTRGRTFFFFFTREPGSAAAASNGTVAVPSSYNNRQMEISEVEQKLLKLILERRGRGRGRAENQASPFTSLGFLLCISDPAAVSEPTSRLLLRTFPSDQSLSAANESSFVRLMMIDDDGEYLTVPKLY